MAMMTAMTITVSQLGTNGVVSYAQQDQESTSYETMLTVLQENGYTETAAESLGTEIETVYESILAGETVDVETSVMEVDNLTEIEEFLSSDEKELTKMGFSDKEIKSATEEVEEMLSMDNEELSESYGLDNTEIKMLRTAEENAEERNSLEDGSESKKIGNRVKASGSISSSEMTYTQTVINRSTASKPKYDVTLSYQWSTPYWLTSFNDKIAVAWGGGFNTTSTNYTAQAWYYDWNVTSTKWKSTLCAVDNMSYTDTPNRGIIFSLKQGYGVTPDVKTAKTKKGHAKFTIFQTKKKGYSTKIISNYCHRTVALTGVSLAVDGSPRITIGGAWDATAQKATNVIY